MADKKGLPFAPPPPDGGTEQPDGDFVFRFRLEPIAQDETGYDDPLLELVRGQLADLLDVVVFTYHGQPVLVDGFRLIAEPAEQYEVFPAREDGEAQNPDASETD